MRIPVFGLGVVSRSNFVTSAILQNMYLEKRPRGEKSALVGYGTPGLDLFTSFGDTQPRGGIEFEEDSVGYVVHRGTLWEVNNAGIKTNRGTLGTTTGRVSMAHNGLEVAIVDGSLGYIYNTTTHAFTQPATFPANPTTVAYLSQRFIVSIADSSRFNVSDIATGTTWDALMFANAETSPDPIIAVFVSNGQLVLLGPLTTEFWGNSGTLDFPFVALQGTANEWGLAARWSLAKFDNSFAMLVKNRMGEVMIAKMGGYLPQKISTPDIDDIINGYASVSDATAYSYMLGGHPMYVISFPSAGASWLYDGSTGYWSKLKSFGITRHVGEFSFTLLAATIVADYTNGNLYRLNGDTFTENGASIENEIISETVADPDLDRIEVTKFRADFDVGNGTATGQGSNPQVSLQVSRDNGKTWGAEMWRDMGPIGNYGITVDWGPLGEARNFVFRLKHTDPTQFVVVSACVNPED